MPWRSLGIILLLLFLLQPSDSYAAEVSCGRVNVYVINLYTSQNVPNAQAGIRCTAVSPDDGSRICPANADYRHEDGACWENSGYQNVPAPPTSNPIVFGNPNDENDFTQGYDCDKGGGELYVSVPSGWALQCVRDGSSTNCSDGNSVDPANLSLTNGANNVVKAYYKPPPPAVPTLSNLSNICSSPGTTATLTFSSTDARYYQLRVDAASDSWGSCTSPATGDICNDNASSPYPLTTTAGTQYRWWVHACNDPSLDGSNCSAAADNTFTCPSAPTGLSASCPAPGTTATLSWTNGIAATAHNLRVNKITGAIPEWNGNCTSPQPGDFCRDTTSSPQSFSSTAGTTYSWWVDACNAAGCSTANGSNFTCVAPAATLSVSCSVNPTSAFTGQSVTWTANASGGTSPFTYSWSGTDSLQGRTTADSTDRVNDQIVTYSTQGTKTGSVRITDRTGTQSPLTDCTNSVTITLPPPTVTTNPATSVAATTATLNSTINPNGLATTSWFRYDSADPGTCNNTFGTQVPSTPTSRGSDTADVNYSQNLTGLTTGTIYYFCAIANNASGTSLGSVLSFTPSATPDFSLVNSGNCTATQRGSNSSCSTITVSPVAGFNSTVSLSAAAAGGATVSIPASLASAAFATGAVLNVINAGTCATYPCSKTITITGTGGTPTLTRTTRVTLTVNAAGVVAPPPAASGSIFEIIPFNDTNGNGVKDSEEGCRPYTVQITPSNCSATGGGTCDTRLPFSFNNISGECDFSPVTSSLYLNLIRGSSTADPCPTATATFAYYCLPKGTSWDLTITLMTGSNDVFGNTYEFEPPIDPTTGARHTWTRRITIP